MDGTQPQLQRLDHVSLNVSDRARSIAWYRDVLGLEPQNEPRADDWPVFLGDRCWLALFQARSVDSEGGVRDRVGLRHVAFAVGRGEPRRAKAHLRARAVSFDAEDHGSRRSVYFRDPDGNVIELTSAD